MGNKFRDRVKADIKKYKKKHKYNPFKNSNRTKILTDLKESIEISHADNDDELLRIYCNEFYSIHGSFFNDAGYTNSTLREIMLETFDAIASRELPLVLKEPRNKLLLFSTLFKNEILKTYDAETGIGEKAKSVGKKVKVFVGAVSSGIKITASVDSKGVVQANASFESKDVKKDEESTFRHYSISKTLSGDRSELAKKLHQMVFGLDIKRLDQLEVDRICYLACTSARNTMANYFNYTDELKNKGRIGNKSENYLKFQEFLTNSFNSLLDGDKKLAVNTSTQTEKVENTQDQAKAVLVEATSLSPKLGQKHLRDDDVKSEATTGTPTGAGQLLIGSPTSNKRMKMSPVSAHVTRSLFSKPSVTFPSIIEEQQSFTVGDRPQINK